MAGLLSGLPKDERKACRTLWAWVDAMLARASQSMSPSGSSSPGEVPDGHARRAGAGCTIAGSRSSDHGAFGLGWSGDAWSLIGLLYCDPHTLGDDPVERGLDGVLGGGLFAGLLDGERVAPPLGMAGPGIEEERHQVTPSLGSMSHGDRKVIDFPGARTIWRSA